MDIALKEILNINIESVRKLCCAEVSYRTARKIRHNADVIDTEITSFNGFMQELIKQYGEYEDESKKTLTVESTNLINEKLTEATEDMIDLDIQMIEESEIENIKVSAQDLLNIDFMIKSED